MTDWQVGEKVVWVCLHPLRQQVRGPVRAGPVSGGGPLSQRVGEGRGGRAAEEGVQGGVHTLDTAVQARVELIRWMAE